MPGCCFEVKGEEQAIIQNAARSRSSSEGVLPAFRRSQRRGRARNEPGPGSLITCDLYPDWLLANPERSGGVSDGLPLRTRRYHPPEHSKRSRGLFSGGTVSVSMRNVLEPLVHAATDVVAGAYDFVTALLRNREPFCVVLQVEARLIEQFSVEEKYSASTPSLKSAVMASVRSERKTPQAGISNDRVYIDRDPAAVEGQRDTASAESFPVVVVARDLGWADAVPDIRGSSERACSGCV